MMKNKRDMFFHMDSYKHAVFFQYFYTLIGKIHKKPNNQTKSNNSRPK